MSPTFTLSFLRPNRFTDMPRNIAPPTADISATTSVVRVGSTA